MAHKFALRLGAAILLLSGFSTTQVLAAGRCGYSFPVDAPTTLAKVARACNVSLAALREANPGVDPAYVSPGEHLAVPDEIDNAADVPAGDANVGLGNIEAAAAPIYRYVEYTEPARSGSQASGQGKTQSLAYGSATSPYYVQASTFNTRPYFRENETLSYQKRSAARIRNAGVPITTTSPATLAPIRNIPQAAVEISITNDLPPAKLNGGALSPLMECSVWRRQSDGKIAQVREFKPAPEGRETPIHCKNIATTSSSAYSPRAVFARSAYNSLPPLAEIAVVEGFVTDANAECVTVLSEDGAVWRVGVDLAPMELLGKNATIWAEVTDERSCDGLVLSHAVYAERVR
ncbi:MAG: hypothetical protein AAFW68_02305 [Pseudomonadota bacterium]